MVFKLDSMKKDATFRGDNPKSVLIRSLAIGISILLVFSTISAAPGNSFFHQGNAELSPVKFDLMDSNNEFESDAINQMAVNSVPFVKNVGQLDSAVAYSTQTFAGNVFVTHDGLTYLITEGNGGIAVKETFANANVLQPIGTEESSVIVNYFAGEVVY